MAHSNDSFYLVEDVNGRETNQWNLTFSSYFLSAAWYYRQVIAISLNNISSINTQARTILTCYKTKVSRYTCEVVLNFCVKTNCLPWSLSFTVLLFSVLKL